MRGTACSFLLTKRKGIENAVTTKTESFKQLITDTSNAVAETRRCWTQGDQGI
nr:MAG: hypothetical protein ADFBMEEK_00090 [Peromyscus leucopus gammaherpesvirus]